MGGGNYDNGGNDGPFYFNCNNGWTNSNWNYGFRSILNNSTNKSGECILSESSK